MRTCTIAVSLGIIACGTTSTDTDASITLDAATASDGAPPAVEGGLDSGTDADVFGVDAGAAVPDCRPSNFSHDGVQRGYILCVPDPLPSGRLPVILGFHGGGGRARAWQQSLPWHETGAREGFVFVYMQGCRTGEADCSGGLGSYLWNVGKPSADTSASEVDDQGYTLAVVERLSSEHGLSVGPLFATGHSLGGMFAYSLRCDRPELFRAIGPFGSTPSDGTCTPSGDTSVYHVHGLADANVPFLTGCCAAAQRDASNAGYVAGCEAYPECANARNWWPPTRDGVHPVADLVGLEEIATTALGCRAERSPIDGRAPCERYLGCREGTEVEECLLPDVGHGLRDIDAAFDLRDYFWARFQEHL